MQNNIIIPSAQSIDSYVIQAEATAEAKYVNHQPATKQQILKAMADFLVTVTNELREARAHNRENLRHLK